MLVIRRIRGESIMIGDDVEIKILDLTKGNVWVGIEAPKTIPVHRREIYDDIQKDKPEEKKHENQEKNSNNKKPYKIYTRIVK